MPAACVAVTPCPRQLVNRSPGFVIFEAIFLLLRAMSRCNDLVDLAVADLIGDVERNLRPGNARDVAADSVARSERVDAIFIFL